MLMTRSCHLHDPKPSSSKPDLQTNETSLASQLLTRDRPFVFVESSSFIVHGPRSCFLQHNGQRAPLRFGAFEELVTLAAQPFPFQRRLARRPFPLQEELQVATVQSKYSSRLAMLLLVWHC